MRESLEQKERIVSYWTRRSDGFAAQRAAELESGLHERWLKLIKADLLSVKPEWAKVQERSSHEAVGLRPLKILDVGTGSGFFAILLSLTGHQVMGIDLTEAMIRHAAGLAAQYGCSAEFLVMDAENLDFEDKSFDVVISRNLTWILPDPQRAYQEWMRVLRPGGVLLNYDADYGMACFTEPEDQLPAEHAHNKIGRNMMQECQNLKDELDISSWRRPEWDASVLRQIGYEELDIDREVSKYIYREKDEFYNPVPLFSLKVVKKYD